MMTFIPSASPRSHRLPIEASRHLFRPTKGGLVDSYQRSAPQDRQSLAREICMDIGAFIQEQTLPWLPALRWLGAGDYRVGVYERFGTGRSSLDLAQDLYAFREEQRASPTRILTFFAVFPERETRGSAAFESAFWRELQLLSGYDALSQSAVPTASSDWERGHVRLALGDTTFFIVGLHRNHPIESRCFLHTTLAISVVEPVFGGDR